MAQDWKYDTEVVIKITCTCKNLIRFEEQLHGEEKTITCPQCGATYTITDDGFTDIDIIVSKTPHS